MASVSMTMMVTPASKHVLLLHFNLLGMTLLGVELGPQTMDLLCELGALVHHTSFLLAAALATQQ